MPARNVALELARSEGLAMMGAGDILVPSRLELLRSCAAEHPDLGIFTDIISREWDPADPPAFIDEAVRKTGG